MNLNEKDCLKLPCYFCQGILFILKIDFLFQELSSYLFILNIDFLFQELSSYLFILNIDFLFYELSSCEVSTVLCLLTVKRNSCPREGEIKLKIVDLK